MTIHKRLLQPYEQSVDILIPVSVDELAKREKEYPLLTPRRFGFNRTNDAFKPVSFSWKNHTFDIQYNMCANPLCKNHGQNQVQYAIKGKPSRYKITGRDFNKRIVCNPNHIDPEGVPTLGCYTNTLSNWSLVEEIERLIRINTVVPTETGYFFHKPSCSNDQHNPFDNIKSFYKKGINSAKSQRYQCKDCKKITSVKPNKSRRTNFNQKRNDILPLFAKLLINKTPISRACEILKIGRGTYYQKLEWLYRCCLEFLETRETKMLENRDFDELWITTDKLHYVLNNVLKRGQGKNRGLLMEDKQLPTFVVASADVNSRYVFRADVCFDWDITIDQIQQDTLKYKEDHLNNFSRKNERFGGYAVFPIKPTENDTQTMAEYQKELTKINVRQHYVDGLHVGATYTTMAHFWLLKQCVKTRRWRFVTDDDLSLKTAISRLFSGEINEKKAHHFLCLTDKEITRKDAKKVFTDAIRFLKSWAKGKGLAYDNVHQLALWYVEDQLKTHKFHERLVTKNGEIYHKQVKNRLKHPIPTSDRGNRLLDALTDVSHLTDFQLASLLVGVNDNAINGFFQTIRRRLSILERPLVTARGDGKSLFIRTSIRNMRKWPLRFLERITIFVCLIRRLAKKQPLHNDWVLLNGCIRGKTLFINDKKTLNINSAFSSI